MSRPMIFAMQAAGLWLVIDGFLSSNPMVIVAGIASAVIGGVAYRDRRKS